jgi:hypothetical protein
MPDLFLVYISLIFLEKDTNGDQHGNKKEVKCGNF